ncbi:hypothetical protein [Aminobacterium mobile]|uniref:hypothetical protein n=1 Tax=Aminobacterium mobile TaxID=81467 RepID=UPI0004641164|nr:hypothetical protein [Aminobacterium mobile]
MSYEEVFNISIPSDNDGFVLLKCPSCNEKFMIQVDDIEDDSVIDIWCPHCGLKHDSYLDDNVNDLAEKIIQNHVADLLNDFSKDIEKIFKNNKNVKYKAGKTLEKESEIPIGRKTGDYDIKNYLCCGKTAKIRSITKFEGGYCPFCGEIVDGD